METLSTPKPKIPPEKAPPGRFYHGTLVRLDGQPLFARGTLPTIHRSLTYTVWYIYWMSRLDRTTRNPSFFIYQLLEAYRYLVPYPDGAYSVSEIGAVPYDDRNEGLLKEAPELFKKRWDWAGKLTYLPARCLARVSASVIKDEVSLEEWLELCQSMDAQHPFKGMLPSHINPRVDLPDFLKNRG